MDKHREAGNIWLHSNNGSNSSNNNESSWMKLRGEGRPEIQTKAQGQVTDQESEHHRCCALISDLKAT